jgi:hypothetical protein
LSGDNNVPASKFHPNRSNMPMQWGKNYYYKDAEGLERVFLESIVKGSCRRFCIQEPTPAAGEQPAEHHFTVYSGGADSILCDEAVDSELADEINCIFR